MAITGGDQNPHLKHGTKMSKLFLRVSLGDSQKLTAIAQLSDGSFWSDEAEVIVTLPACAES
jgi:sulfur-oxidizing protein SoxY